MKKSPFTLIEILVVIVIIIILAGMLMPIIRKAAQRADEADTIERLKVLEKILDEYKEHHGHYPQSAYYSPYDASSAAIALTTAFLDDPTHWKAIPKYSGKTPSQILWISQFGPSSTFDGYLTDVSEEPIYYQCPGTMNPEKYDLWSTGADAQHGDGGTNTVNAQNRNDNDDITNWKSDF